MRRRGLMLSVSVLLATSCAVHVRAEATKLRPREPAFTLQRVEVVDSSPVRFQVLLDRDMPTPGWRFEVDGVAIDRDARRIVARVSEVRPGGLTSQVITATTCSLPLGALESGRWLLEVRLRRGREGAHKPVQALVFDAS